MGEVAGDKLNQPNRSLRTVSIPCALLLCGMAGSPESLCSASPPRFSQGPGQTHWLQLLWFLWFWQKSQGLAGLSSFSGIAGGSVGERHFFFHLELLISKELS